MNSIDFIKVVIAHPSFDVNFKCKFCKISPLITAYNEHNIDVIKLFLTIPDLDLNQHDEFGINFIMRVIIDNELEINL